MGTGGGLVVIDFSDQGNSAYFRRDGWSGQESDRVWAIGPSSVVSVPLQASGRAVMLEVELAPGEISRFITGQLVRIRVNGTAIGGARIGSRTMLRCEIDPALAGQQGELRIEFEFPGFYRADLIGASGDDRPMSCWFSFARIYTRDMYKPGPWFPPSHPDITVTKLAPPIEPARSGAAAQIFTFGDGGTASPFLRDGWSTGEGNFNWSERNYCELQLPAPALPGAYVLRVEATPFVIEGRLPAQDVTVILDGIVIGQYSLRERSIWIVPLPRELTDGRTILALTFLLPRAASPSEFGPSGDTRRLGLAVTRIDVLAVPPRFACVESLRAEQAGIPWPRAISARFVEDDEAEVSASISAVPGMDPIALIRGFEGLGTSPEFGIVQRKLGLEIFNLFHGCEASLSDLTRALTDDLRAANSADQVDIDFNGYDTGRYVVALRPYNLRWHKNAHESEADRASLREINAVALGYLRRKFYEGLHTGRKIYVLSQRRPVPASQAAALLLELSRFGSATLLCVEEAPEGRRPGEVELLMPDLMRGYIARFARDDDWESVDPADWLRVLGNAMLLKRGMDRSGTP